MADEANDTIGQHRFADDKNYTSEELGEIGSLYEYIECWRIVDHLVDVPKDFAKFSFPDNPGVNPFPEAVKHLNGSDRYKRWRVRRNIVPLFYGSITHHDDGSNEALRAGAPFPELKSVVTLGVIDSVIPLFIAAEATSADCKKHGCRAWAFLDPQQSSEHKLSRDFLDSVPLFGPILIDAHSFVRATDAYDDYGHPDLLIGSVFSENGVAAKFGELVGVDQILSISTRYMAKHCEPTGSRYRPRICDSIDGHVARIIKDGTSEKFGGPIDLPRFFDGDQAVMGGGHLLFYFGEVAPREPDRSLVKCYDYPSID